MSLQSDRRIRSILIVDEWVLPGLEELASELNPSLSEKEKGNI